MLLLAALCAALAPRLSAPPCGSAPSRCHVARAGAPAHPVAQTYAHCKHHLRRASIQCCSAPADASGSQPPKPKMDPRGFKIPQVGDVVKMPSKWPGEYEVAQVDYVQFIASRGAYEADVLPLKATGNSMYRLPGRKPASMRVDVAKLGNLNAEYEASTDSYRVDESKLLPVGGQRPANASVTAAGIEEYELLKTELLIEAVALSLFCSIASLPLYGSDITIAYAEGAVAGLIYLKLLQLEVDATGNDSAFAPALLSIAGARLGLPVLLFCIIGIQNHGLLELGSTISFSVVSRSQFLATVLGFLTYKVPLLVKQTKNAIDALSEESAQAPLEAGGLPTGSLGMMMNVLQRNANMQAAAVDNLSEEDIDSALRPIVLSGPAGVGKSTLISRLLEARPDRFGIAVACTTRPKQDGEVDGVDYRFVSEEDFEGMERSGDLIQSSLIGKYKYGISLDEIRAVAKSSKTCLLDMNVVEVEAMLGRNDILPYYVWVSPQTLESLRNRIKLKRDSGTDIDDQIMKQAREEITLAMSLRCFDKIIINNKIEESFAELLEAALTATSSSKIE